MFDDLKARVQHAEIRVEPFEHLVVFNALNDDDFDALTAEPSVKSLRSTSHRDLIDKIIEQGGDVYNRAGCVDNVDAYIGSLEKRLSSFEGTTRQPANAELVSSVGLSLRIEPHNSHLATMLLDYLSSGRFSQSLATKLGVETDYSVNVGLYKFLTGYDIAPHSDSRRKALTFLLNLTPRRHSRPGLGTHLHRLKPAFAHAEAYWESHPDVDRCWIPRDWVETVREYYEPNTLIAFRPTSKSLHSVQLAYDHREFQRTTILGNLWCAKQPTHTPGSYRDIQAWPAKRVVSQDVV